MEIYKYVLKCLRIVSIMTSTREMTKASSLPTPEANICSRDNPYNWQQDNHLVRITKQATRAQKENLSQLHPNHRLSFHSQVWRANEKSMQLQAIDVPLLSVFALKWNIYGEEFINPLAIVK